MIRYPEELPLPLQDSYSIGSPVDPMLRTPMESGRARQRVNFDFTPEHPSFKLNFSRNEAAFFRGWYARALNNGVEWFVMKLLLPEGFKDYECRFVGKPAETQLVQVSRWEISATVELREPSLMEPGWEDFPQFWFMMGIIDLAVNVEWTEA